eukprot:TRINITY_DN253_c0_g1_i1.p1 TRINITY_DN253_c0_g1~~TRINITY_DN253_c0_g1_i1.p1  ORF type:complete len:108 (-),score=21.42 TRINITY_DN253_c0_g1_i1:53-376(-)
MSQPMLRFVKSVKAVVNPWDHSVLSSREFLARISANKVTKTNPKCVYDIKVDWNSAPHLEIEFIDNTKLAIDPKGISDVRQIMTQIKNKAIDIEEVYSEKGIDLPPI